MTRIRRNRLLKDSGHEGGKRLTIEIIYPVGLEEYKTDSEFFQSQMNDIGVKVTVTGMELAAWSNKIIKEKTYELAFDGRGVEINEPARSVQRYDLHQAGQGELRWFR